MMADQEGLDDTMRERTAVLALLRGEAERMRGVANEYIAKHNDPQAARRWLRDAELLGQMANRIERREHRKGDG